jgi:hypothetical protein
MSCLLLQLVCVCTCISQGCVWHGCPICSPDRTLKHPRTKASVEELYTLTLKKKSTLQSLGYKYVCMWEHEFQKMKEDIQPFLSTLDLQARLDPRHSFFGGRTNCTRLHYHIGPGEIIKYVDFCRWVQVVFIRVITLAVLCSLSV